MLLPFAAAFDTLAPYIFDAILAMLAFLTLTRRRKELPVNLGFEAWIGAYLLFAVAAGIIGYFRGTLTFPEEGLPTLARTLELALIAPLLTTHLHAPRPQRSFITMLVIAAAGACLVSIHVIVETWASGTLDGERWRLAERMAGTLAWLIPILVAIGIERRLPFSLGLAGALMAAVYLSGSRAAAVGAAAGCTVVILAGARKTRPWELRARVAVVVVSACIAIFFSTDHMRSGLQSLRDGSAQGEHDFGRARAWQVSSLEVLEHPLTGRGVGAIRRAFYEGDWIRVLHETGFPGLFLLGAALAALARILHARRGQPIAAGLLGSLCVLVIRSAFGSPFLRASDGAFFMLMAGGATRPPE